MFFVIVLHHCLEDISPPPPSPSSTPLILTLNLMVCRSSYQFLTGEAFLAFSRTRVAKRDVKGRTGARQNWPPSALPDTGLLHHRSRELARYSLLSPKSLQGKYDIILRFISCLYLEKVQTKVNL